jgi:RES domain-containing protein
MILYRFVRSQYSNDLSGEGARRFGGRWNSAGNPVLYTSFSISLALLELLIHNASHDEIISNQLITIEIPDVEYKELSALRLKNLWYEDENYTKNIGDDFLASQSSLLLKVPSSIIPEEYNMLINPRHVHFKKVKIKQIRTFRFNVRLFKS